MRGLGRRFGWMSVAVVVLLLLTETASPAPASKLSGPGAEVALQASQHNAGLTTSAPTDAKCLPVQGQPLAGSVPGSGLPPLPCLVAIGNSGADSYRMEGFPSTSRSQLTKAKIDFALPPVNIAAYEVVCIYTIRLKFPAKCPYDVGFPSLEPSVGNGFDGIGATAWIQSPPGVQPEFGVFPPFQIGVLAFGSIPVTATVHISQPISDGVVQPLTLRWWTEISSLRPGQEIPGYESYGPAPAQSPSGGLTFFAPPASITGALIVRLSDVKVDQVPLNVGDDCQTAAAADLSEVPGYYGSASPPVEHKPGEWLPLANETSYISAGHIDLPAFTGCHNGAENLDPLITGMVSGPGDPIQITQKRGLTSWCSVAKPPPSWCATAARTNVAVAPIQPTTFTADQRAVIDQLPTAVRETVLREAGQP